MNRSDTAAATGFPGSGGVTAYLELPGAGEEKAQVFPLHDEAVIGRAAQDSLAQDRVIRLPGHTVSRRHARIRRRGALYYIEDLHSFNGTFVRGKRLQPGVWYPLRDGDEIAIAAIALGFHSLMVPAADSLPTVITRSIDAQDLTRVSVPEAGDSEAQRTMLKLHAMAQVGIALGAVTDRVTLTEKIMNFIFQLFPLAERAFILLRKKEGEAPVPTAARWRDGTVVDPAQVVMSRTIVGEVLDKKRSVLSVDTLADRHFGAQESIVSQAIRSVMCVPLLLEGECLGLIQVDTSSDPYAFKEADLEILTGVCAEAAVALKNFQLYSDIERLLDGFVRASVQAIEERDPVTAGHSFRVAGYAERLITAVDRATAPGLAQLQFSKEQVRELRYAALLHDFGKVGVREHVLRKEKKLHHADMRVVEQRFLHVRACLERQAWRSLVEQHAAQGLAPDLFRQRQREIEQALQLEFARLDQFMATIRAANEPAVSPDLALPDLTPALCWQHGQAEGAPLKLLTEEEYAALGVTRGCLTPDERRQIEAHVADSYSFLILIPWTRDLAGVPGIAHGHHEKLDGSGYPMGLREPQISIQTRILTICDIYDALTAADRPYKKQVPVERALDLIALECRAGHLDQQLFDVFVQSRAWEPL